MKKTQIKISKRGMFRKLKAMQQVFLDAGKVDSANDVLMLSRALGVSLMEDEPQPTKCDCPIHRDENIENDEWEEVEVEEENYEKDAREAVESIMRGIAEKVGIPIENMRAVNMGTGDVITGEDLEDDDSDLPEVARHMNHEYVATAASMIDLALKAMYDTRGDLTDPIRESLDISIQGIMNPKYIKTVADAQYVTKVYNDAMGEEFGLLFTGPSFVGDAPAEMLEFSFIRRNKEEATEIHHISLVGGELVKNKTVMH
jgi:hypothetical protein